LLQLRNGGIFFILLRRAGLPASAGLSCLKDTFVSVRKQE